MIFTVDMVYTVDIVFTVDIVYTVDRVCTVEMDGTDGSHPSDRYDYWSTGGANVNTRHFTRKAKISNLPDS